MVVASCENLAFAPDWWEGLRKDEQRTICSALGVNLFDSVRPDYLATGLEGIGDWETAGVYTRMKT